MHSCDRDKGCKVFLSRISSVAQDFEKMNASFDLSIELSVIVIFFYLDADLQVQSLKSRYVSRENEATSVKLANGLLCAC